MEQVVVMIQLITANTTRTMKKPTQLMMNKPGVTTNMVILSMTRLTMRPTILLGGLSGCFGV